ncbi:dTDP-4-dehydrorhamnose reductase [Haloarcula sp. Atlit-47R]|uniref:dTDP-4-dehydrorhamnose reductase n=1 Tax=Haloarcula sp. Atlit-47R TaxID=2282132 RepID=UPI000EF24BBB|nr:dTDP-4-dehydrorhamnose reductase [Haloarcula sp. Atlit-47R]RLM42588.1 dTDP-4-dehydrorhamnose reductase [Haloarcula sp. Atlit-47R]
MHLLVLGANGLLGSNAVQAGLEKGWTVSGTYHSTAPDFDIPLFELDIIDSSTTSEIIEAVDPDWVVNCAAMTDVDGCEEHPDRAHDVNAQAPGEIAAYCNQAECEFLHVSTDYVFDGKSTASYSENDSVNPVQVYGQSKLDGERAVQEVMPEALVTRLSFVYGVHRGTDELAGFPKWVRDQLVADNEVPLFTDQHITPSRAGHTASTLLELIEAGASGTYNVACRSCVSPYEFGAAICDRMGAAKSLLEDGSQSDIERPATRPAHTCLDVTKTEDKLGRRQPTLTADLEAISGWFDSEPKPNDR